MPINQEQAREYARRFNEEPEFRQALQRARRFMDSTRRDDVVFQTMLHIQVESPVHDELVIDRDSMETYHLSREDMERIDQALTGNQPQPCRPRFRVSGDFPQGATLSWDDIRDYFYEGARQIASSNPGRLTGRSGATLTTDELFRELTQPEPEPDRRETPTMSHFAIPHPFADFGPDTEFLFFNNFHATHPYVTTAKEMIGRTALYRVLSENYALEQNAKDRRGTADLLSIPDRNDPNNPCPALSFNPGHIGLPLLQRPAPEDFDDPQSVVYVSDDHRFVLRPEGTRINLPPDTGEKYQHHKPLAVLPQPIDFYFEHAPQTPVRTVTDAWNRCSQSWRDWALNLSPIDADILLWQAMVTYPDLFGLQTCTDMTALWGDPEVCDGSRYMALSCPTYNPDDKTVTMYRTPTDLTRDKRTTMRVGKAIRHLFPGYDDDTVKNTTTRLIGRLTPPEFRIGTTKADFDFAYTEGPSSCMTYNTSQYRLLMNRNDDIRPTDAYINGDIAVAMIVTGEKVTARSLVVQSTKKYVRVYGADFSTQHNGHRALTEWLESQGYIYDERALVGQKLVKIDLGYDKEEITHRVGSTCGLDHAMLYDTIMGLYPWIPANDINAALEKLNPRAYAVPYIDWGGFCVRDEGDHLVVTRHNDESNQKLYSALRAELRRGTGHEEGSRPNYQAGGVVLGDLQAVKDHLAQFPRPEVVDNSPDPFTDILNGMAARAEPTRSTLETELEALRREGNDTDSPSYPVYDDGVLTEAHATEDQINELRPNTAWIVVNHPSSRRCWCNGDEVAYDIDGDPFIDDLAERYGLVWSTHEQEWIYEEHAICLDDDTWAPDDADYIVWIGDQAYHQDDDDLCYVERHGEYAHREDCIVTVNDEYEYARECYELPDGNFVHEDDLTRAA